MYKLLLNIRIALRALWTNKMRAVLTLLGMVIGVGAVVTITSLAEGLNNNLTSWLTERGTNLMWIMPDRPERARKDPTKGWNFKPLKWDHMKVVEEEASEYFEYVLPMAVSMRELKVGGTADRVFVAGVIPDYFAAYDLDPETGRTMYESDIKARGNVIFLGHKIAQDFFFGADPVGQRVRLHGIPLTVAGVLESEGEGKFGVGSSNDDLVFVPLTTFLTRIQPSEDIQYAMMKLRDFDRLDEAKAKLFDIMKRERHIREMQDIDFTILAMSDIMEQLKQFTTILGLVFGSFAAISLLIGGIGIMNIMLVSVRERTREIGLRKALGAKTRDVMGQFLIESLTLCILGGCIGLLLGWGLAELLSNLMEQGGAGSGPGGQGANPFTPYISTITLTTAFGISSAIGLLFGLWPAWAASRLDPIEALRYE
jgi:putative ABC transport system permease protein